MSARRRLALAAMVATATAGCSLVASLGSDYTMATDASKPDEDATATDAGNGGDGGGGHPGDSAGDGPTTSAEAAPPCTAAGLDPTFANGPIAALFSNESENYDLIGAVLGSDGMSLVAAVTHHQGPVIHAGFVKLGAQGALVGDASGAEVAGQTALRIAGNGTEFATLNQVVDDAGEGVPIVLTVTVSNADGDLTTFDVSQYGPSDIALDDRHVLLAVGAAQVYGIERYYFDGGPEQDGAQILAPVDASADGGVLACTESLAAAGGGTMEIEANCTMNADSQLMFAPSAPSQVLLVSPAGQVQANAQEPLPSSSVDQAYAIVAATGDTGAYLLASDPSSPYQVSEILLVDPTGVPVTSFNDGKWLVTSLPGFQVQALAADAQGGVWLAGVAQLADGGNAAGVARMLGDGGLDRAWADGGYASFESDAGPVKLVSGAVVRSDGRLIVYGAIDLGVGLAQTPALFGICPP